MKIIHKGTIPLARPEWWHGVQLTCTLCGTVVELELGDAVHAFVERRPNGRRTVSIACPVCIGICVQKKEETK